MLPPHTEHALLATVSGVSFKAAPTSAYAAGKTGVCPRDLRSGVRPEGRGQAAAARGEGCASRGCRGQGSRRAAPQSASSHADPDRDRKQSGVTWGGGVSRKLFGEDRVSTGEDRKCCGWPVVVAAHLRIGFTSLSCALENG